MPNAVPDGFGGSPSAAAKAVAFLKTLSHEGRLQILCHLLDQDRTVSALVETVGLPQPVISQQLMRLRAEGYVDARRCGKTVVYHLARPEVTPIIAALRDVFCADPQNEHP